MILSLLTSSNKLRTLPHSSAYGPAQPGIPFAQATYSAHHSFLCKWKQSHLTKSEVQRSLPISKMTNHCNASLTSATPYFQVIYSSHQYSSSPKPFAGWFGRRPLLLLCILSQSNAVEVPATGHCALFFHGTGSDGPELSSEVF